MSANAGIYSTENSEEPTYRTEPFAPAFLTRWRGFNTLRFMNWMVTNGSKQRN